MSEHVSGAIHLVNALEDTIEDDAAIFLKGIAEPFIIQSIRWMGPEVPGIVEAVMGTNQSLIFHADQIIALRTPEP